MRDFLQAQFKMLDRGIVATPNSREDLEAFAKANNGSMDIILMQMAINFGYKLALENVQEVLDKDNEDEFEKEAREIENIEKDNN